MSSSFKYGWQNLPDLLFNEVKVMVEIGRLNELYGGPFNQHDELQKCRQVCQSWNAMVSQMTRLMRDTIRKRAEGLAAFIRERWVESGEKAPSIYEISDAASLSHHGMLSSVEWMWLSNVDLACVPAEHLASLTSCVTQYVSIYNVSNCDIISILESVKGQGLYISSQTLSSEETQALVRAMESGVEFVELGKDGEVNLDITALTQYSGQGNCLRVSCWGDTAERYREEMSNLAQRINWENVMSPIQLNPERLNLRIIRKF